MKNIWCFIFLIAIVSSDTLGQVIISTKGVKDKVSGYLGKRNVVQAKGLFSISRQPQQALSQKPPETFQITLNREFELNIEKVLTNRKSLGFILGGSSTSLKFDVPDNYVLMEGGGLSFVNGTPAMTDKYFGIRCKMYNRSRGGLAPIGHYWAFNVNLHSYKIDMSGLDFVVYKEGPSGYFFAPYKLEDGVHKYTLAEFGISTGVNRIFAQRVVLDYGVQFSFTRFDRLFGLLRNDYREATVTAEEFLTRSIVSRISWFHIMKYYIAVGYLF
jgi:hypothetical protein